MTAEPSSRGPCGMEPPSPVDPWPLSGSAARLALLALLLFFAAWDLRAVLLDNRFALTDTTLEDVLHLASIVDHGHSRELLPEWFLERRKGPLAGVVGGIIWLIQGDPLVAARLVGVFAQVPLLLVVYLLGVRATGSRGTGLLAAVVAGTFPGQYGWMREELHESLLIPLTAAGLLLLSRPLRRDRTALLLGVVLGLGILAKTAYPLFIVVPGLLFVACTVRRWPDVNRLLLAGAAMLLVAGIWLAPNLERMVDYAQASSRGVPLSDRIQAYTQAIPRSGAYLAAALLGAVAAWLGRGASRFAVLLLLGSLAGGLGLLMTFDSWARYLSPGYPAAGVLVALGLHAAGGWAARRGRAGPARAGAALVVVALLSTYVRENVTGVAWPGGVREFGSGLVAPDTRPHDGFVRAVELVRSTGTKGVWVPLWPPDRDLMPMDLTVLWIQRGHDPGLTDGNQALHELRQRGRIHVIFHRPPRMEITTGAAWEGGPHALRTDDPVATLRENRPQDGVPESFMNALKEAKLKHLRTWKDPDGRTFSVIEARKSVGSSD